MTDTDTCCAPSERRVGIDEALVRFATELVANSRAGRRPGMLATAEPYEPDIYSMLTGATNQLASTPSPHAAAQAALILLGEADLAHMGFRLICSALDRHPLAQHVRLGLNADVLAAAGHTLTTLGAAVVPPLAIQGRSILQAVQVARVLGEVRAGHIHHIFGEPVDALFGDLDAAAAIEARFAGRPDALKVLAALVRDAPGISPERFETMIETALVV